MFRLLILCALLMVARVEDAARDYALVHNRSTADDQSNIINKPRPQRSDGLNPDPDSSWINCRDQDQVLENLRFKDFRGGFVSQRLMEAPVSSGAPAGSWTHSLRTLFNWLKTPAPRRHRTTRHTSATMENPVTRSPFGLVFQKCAEVETGSEFPQVRVTLVIKNPAEGSDLSQLCIRDAITDLTLLHTSGSLQERQYQTFSTDKLPAGFQHVVFYTVSVKGNRNKTLMLPAYLTFSNGTQNDIDLFGPVVANFTLRLNATEKVNLDLVVYFTVFIGSFLLSCLLFSLSLLCVKRLQGSRQHRRRKRRSLNEEAGPYEGMCEMSDLLEEKFVDIMMLEDPQNMFHSLDSLSMSALLRCLVSVECVRVQMYKGLLAVLLGGVRAAGGLSGGAERRVLGVLHGQIVGMEGKVQEQHVGRMAALAARCNLETREEMESQHHKHMKETSHAERLFEHAEQQEVSEVRVLVEKLHKEEQQHLQRQLLVRHEHASAQAQRQQALQRRFELHKIFSEELEEATRAGELQKNTADKLLLQYYSCQDDLEEVLDVHLANQRATLAERHSQRWVLVESLLSVQRLINETFSSSSELMTETHRRSGQSSGEVQWFQLQVLRVKQELEESLTRERRILHCDNIKKRRQLLSEKVREHACQMKRLSDICDITVHQYLQHWTELLMNQNTELSELIHTQDEETTAAVHKASLGLLEGSLAELQACAGAACAGVARLLLRREHQEKLQLLQAARRLRSDQNSIRHRRRQELQEQRNIREAFREYCGCLCVSVRSLSHEEWLSVQMECVKAACCLDRCLLLPEAVCEIKLNTNHSAGPCADPDTDPEPVSDPSVKAAALEPRSSELQNFRISLQERLQRLQHHRHTLKNILQKAWREAGVFQQQQLLACQERVSVFVASLQWEHAARRAKVTETHAALLNLHALIIQELQDTDITHMIHTHRLALKEAELQLQKEEAELQKDDTLWVDPVKGRGFVNGSSDGEEGDEEDVFRVDSDSRVSVLLQDVLSKRKTLTHRLTDRVVRRDQTLEYQRDEVQLKRLHMYCDQDLDFTAALVKHTLSAPDLHELLRLLLPTVPEGDLLSLIDALDPKAGGGSCSSLINRLKRDVMSRNLQSLSSADRERDTHRFLKMRQVFLDRLFCHADSSEEVPHERLEPSAQTLMQDISQPADQSSGREPRVLERLTDGLSHVSTEKLFIFRYVPPGTQQHTQTPHHTRRKKRNFLNFKKCSVSPQEHETQ